MEIDVPNLELVSSIGVNKRRQRISQYKCSCGSLFTTMDYRVKSGHTKSCGCLKNALCRDGRLSHDESRPQSIEYRIWSGMKTRCLNKNSSSYGSYGGRGITICASWSDSYESFLADVGRRPSPSHSLDRIDNEKGYEPENVRWSTSQGQARNRRSNRVIDFNGKSQCLQAWAEEIGINQSSLIERLQKWPIEKALTTPRRRK